MGIRFSCAPIRPLALILALLLATALAGPRTAHAGDVLERVKTTRTVRVCIWPEYYGITWRDPRTGEVSGIDIEMSRALAADLGVRVSYVETTFSRFEADLVEQRCDVAMFALAVTAARQQTVRFTQPYLQSGIYALTMRDSGVVRDWADIDQPGVNVGVQANTFMEPVMRAALRHARLVVLPPDVSREGELQAGRIDVVMTDFPYGHRLLENADWARLIAPPAPFHPVQYAYAVRPGDGAWLARLNTFVARVRDDGRLAEAARRNHLTEVLLPR
jgi:cyclohexadienyl dehydratase